MKILVLLLAAFCASVPLVRTDALNVDASNVDELGSGVYRWDALAAETTETGERRAILEGATTDLAHLILHATTLAPGEAPHAAHRHAELEEMIIVKEGRLKVAIEGDAKVLGPGSVALVLPGDLHGFENAGDAPATYYVFRYRSRAPVDLERGRRAGGSFTVDWDDVAMTETEVGGRRQHFDRATAMFERFEMHVSTLNEGLTNHAAHTHRAEEFVVVIKSEVEMLIGETRERAAAGDVIFLASEIPHALDNKGSGQTEYFAFQWQ